MLAGYRYLFSLLSGVIPLLLGILLISGVIVLPLWYLATHHRALYTGLVIAVAVGGGIVLLVRRLSRRGPTATSLRRAGLGAAALFFIYLTIRSVVLGLYLLTPPAAVFALFLTGVALAPKKRV